MTSLAKTVPAKRLLAWLQLLRLPTVFTAMADILCGFLVGAASSGAGEPNWCVLPCLLLSSAGLYLGGMVLNDVFDARLDAVERPERPIPSGRVSIRSAATAGGLLLVIGLVAAIAAWFIVDRVGHSLFIATMTAVSVLIYDTVLKTTWAGPFSMASCRFLNLALGAATAVSAAGAVMSWQQPVLGAAMGLAVYIVGVTWFARNEAGDSSQFGLVGGVIVATVGVAVSAVSTIVIQSDQTIAALAAVQFMGIIIATLVRGSWAIRDGQPPVLQRNVGKMLLWIIVLDAVVVFAVTGSAVMEGVILLLVVPAIALRKRIPMS